MLQRRKNMNKFIWNEINFRNQTISYVLGLERKSAEWKSENPQRLEMRMRHRKRATSLSYQLRMPFGYFIFGRSSNLNINAKSHAHSVTFVMPYQQKCEVEKNISSKIWSLCIDESLEITLEFHNFGFGFVTKESSRRWLFAQLQIQSICYATTVRA